MASLDSTTLNKISLDPSPCENTCPGQRTRGSPLRYKKALSCPISSTPLSPSMAVHRRVMMREHHSASDITNDGGHDPLAAVSCHRRSSFRQSAMSPKANQKKLLLSLKHAVAEAIRTKSAIQLQALARGFLVRRESLQRLKSPKSKSKKVLLQQSNHTHHSMFSELTMSEPEDAVSLGSLDWGTDDDDDDDFTPPPCRQDKHPTHNNKYHNNNNNNSNFENSWSKKFQASTSTALTWLESDFGSRTPQDSFSTLLTRESMDVPIQRPHRRHSPLRSPCSPPRTTTRPPTDGTSTTTTTGTTTSGYPYLSNPETQPTHSHPYFHPISPCSFGEPRRKVSCLRDSPYRKMAATNKLLKAAKLHISLSSIDEPMRRPSRASSPTR